ncbi:MAG: insulinase family protein [Bdellovibrionales bacterium]|nr:insulinase family protein [Bdellovibrionales bacterium]
MSTYLLVIVAAIFSLVSCQSTPKLVKDQSRYPSNSQSIVDNSDVIQQKLALSTSNKKAIKLSNGLDIYLVSDPYITQGSASVNVAVGSLADPKNYQGLAHYLEHMLFLGTEKFPVVGEYDKYLGQNQGQSNAYTDDENTNYFFDVNADALEGALDRFAQFFISPKFDVRYIEKELQNVQLEYDKNIENDYWREQRVIKLASVSGHPLSYFGIGNKESLTGIPQAVLKDFHKKYYIAPAMKLVIIGPQKIDVLEGWAKKYFSGIASKKYKKPTFSSKVVDSNSLPRLLRVPSIVDKESLTMRFYLPTVEPYWAVKPIDKLATLLGDEGPGSLLSVLKEQGFAVELRSGGTNWSFASNLQLNIRLTDMGLKNWPVVVEKVFAYIQILKSAALTESVLSDIVKTRQLRYLFDFEPKTSNEALEITNYMQLHPVQEAIERAQLVYDNDAAVFSKFVNELTPENLLILHSGKGHQNLKKYDEKWKIPYDEISLKDDARVEAWRNPRDEPKLFLPEKNEFLPENIASLQLLGTPDIEPQKVLDQKYVKIWSMVDHEFKRPKVSATFQLFHKQIRGMKPPQTAALARLATIAVAEKVNSWLYSGSLVGYGYTALIRTRKSSLVFNGYSDQFFDKGNEFLKKVSELDLSASEMKRVKEKAFQEIAQLKKQDAFRHAMMGLSQHFEKEAIDFNEEEIWIQKATWSQLKKFLDHQFQYFKLIGFIYGNVDVLKIEPFTNSILSSLGKGRWKGVDGKGLEYGVLKPHRFVHLQKSISVPNSGWYRVFFAAVPSQKRSRAMTQLAAAVLNSAFYQEMRTQKNFGYIVDSWASNSPETDALSFLIQTGRPLSEVETAVMEWMPKSVESVTKMSTSDFAEYKAALATKILSPPVNFTEKMEKKSRQIYFYENDEKYQMELVAELQGITQEELVEFMKATLVHPKTVKSAAFFAIGRDNKAPAQLKSQKMKAGDIKEYKRIPAIR